MKNSINDSFVFLEDESRMIGAEYLLTVNVAKSLSSLNHYIGEAYKVYLERHTRQIATDCVPHMVKKKANNFLGYTSILRRKQHNTKRNGRVDIAVYRDFNGVPLPVCVIELKGFNPKRSEALKDIRRNIEYFHLVDATGRSRIKCTFFAALHSFPKSVTAGQISSDLSSLENKYEKWLAQVPVPKELDIRISINTIHSGVESTKAESEGEDAESIYELEGSHHFAGAIISCLRKT